MFDQRDDAGQIVEVDADDWDDEEEEWDESIVVKWSIDGATTLAEGAEGLRVFAVYLDDLHQQGFLLREPIDNGHGFYYHPDPEINKRHKAQNVIDQ